MSFFRRQFLKSISWLLFPIYVPVVCVLSFISRFLHSVDKRPRFVWGPVPIMNNIYWSRAMREAGYSSETFTKGFYSEINSAEDWDVLIQNKYKYVPFVPARVLLAFVESIFKYDVFVIPFTGYFLGFTPFWRFEALFFILAKKKVVVIPYGSDAYVYKNIRSTSLIHGLMMSYPNASKKQEVIEKRVSYWCQHAHVVVPSIMGPDGLGRWDVLMPSSLAIDLDEWVPSCRKSLSDGFSDVVYIAHAPNHRGFKGSEFVIEAVKCLQREGLKIELILIEKKQNKEVKRTLREDVDILVEQLICTGHGLNAVEGMASGLPTISNLEDGTYTLPLRRWSYLNECPLVSASPETLTDVLRKLVTRPELRHQLGRDSRAYVEKYHGLDSAQYLFGEIVEYIYGRRESLINLYHPLLGEYPRRLPKIEHPLINNHIVD